MPGERRARLALQTKCQRRSFGALQGHAQEPPLLGCHLSEAIQPKPAQKKWRRATLQDGTRSAVLVRPVGIQLRRIHPRFTRRHPQRVGRPVEQDIRVLELKLFQRIEVGLEQKGHVAQFGVELTGRGNP